MEKRTRICDILVDFQTGGNFPVLVGYIYKYVLNVMVHRHLHCRWGERQNHCRWENSPICKLPTETELMARACHYHCPEICYEFDIQKPRILILL